MSVYVAYTLSISIYTASKTAIRVYPAEVRGGRAQKKEMPKSMKKAPQRKR